MQPFISDKITDSRMAGLEQLIQRYLEPQRPEFGYTEMDLESIQMPAPLRRLLRFAGRWPGHNPNTPFANRFCAQDTLCAVRQNGYAPILQLMDDRLVFVWECQGVWVAATEQSGADPPVWISENCSHREAIQQWTQLENPLSHFLVSFVLQELMYGSGIVGVASGALARFEKAGFQTEPVWLSGEYAWGLDRPSYFLVGDSILVRQAPNEADGDDWYGCNNSKGKDILQSLGLPVDI